MLFATAHSRWASNPEKSQCIERSFGIVVMLVERFVSCEENCGVIQSGDFVAQCYIRRDKKMDFMLNKIFHTNVFGLIWDSEDSKICAALQIMTLTNRCRSNVLYTTAMASISLSSLFNAEWSWRRDFWPFKKVRIFKNAHIEALSSEIRDVHLLTIFTNCGHTIQKAY